MAIRTALVLLVLLASPGAWASDSKPAAERLPRGWVALPSEPSEKNLECANWSRNEWHVRWGDDGLAVTKQKDEDKGDPLPFATGLSGRSRVLKVADGYLIGTDMGEFGGGLWWFDPSGKQRKPITVPLPTARGFDQDNVRAILPVGSDAIAFEGLSHLSLDFGKAVYVSGEAGHAARTLAILGGAPRVALAETGHTFLVLTTRSLLRVSLDGRVEVLSTIEQLWGLYPSSMARSPAGTLYVGMRHFVLKLELAPTRVTKTWLVPAECDSVVKDEKVFDCVCTGKSRR